MSTTTAYLQQVIEAHAGMAGEYDDIRDSYYPWLFKRIHETIGRYLPQIDDRRGRAIDAGCGTGFQSFLLARAGYDVIGFDLAEPLLNVAQAKIAAHSRRPLEAPPLFAGSSPPAWLIRHHAELAAQLDRRRAGRDVVSPGFVWGDLATYEFPEQACDVVNCCGSVLSFVDDYASALRRMAGGLRPGGRLFLEVENRTNADLLWPLLLARAYEQERSTTIRNLLRPPGVSVRINYPFPLRDGQEMSLPIWLFSVGELARLFKACGLRVVARIGIHHVTNLLPSLALHGESPGWLVRKLFQLLRPWDGWLSGVWPFWRLGCSVMYVLER